MTLDQLIERLQELRGYNNVRGHWPVLIGEGDSPEMLFSVGEGSIDISFVVQSDDPEEECSECAGYKRAIDNAISTLEAA